MRVLAVAACLAIVLSGEIVSAQDFEKQKQALAEIRQNADAICDRVEHSGASSESQISGEVGAQLPNIASRLLGLGIQGAAKLNNQNYQGVARDQLAYAITHTEDCRKGVFDKLLGILLPTPGRKSEEVAKTTGALTLELQGCEAGLASLQCTFVIEASRSGRLYLVGDTSYKGLMSELIPDDSHHPYPAKVSLDAPQQQSLAMDMIQAGIPRNAYVTILDLPGNVAGGRLIVSYQFGEQTGRAEFHLNLHD